LKKREKEERLMKEVLMSRKLFFCFFVFLFLSLSLSFTLLLTKAGRAR